MQTLFQQVTDTSQTVLTLKGTADVTAKTTIGNVPIAGIAFNVPSSLAGINQFGGEASLSNISVTGSGGSGGNQYVTSPLTTQLDNPSNISLTTNDVALPVIYNGVQLGRAAINVSSYCRPSTILFTNTLTYFAAVRSRAWHQQRSDGVRILSQRPQRYSCSRLLD